jgi:hypothetical protein
MSTFPIAYSSHSVLLLHAHGTRPLPRSLRSSTPTYPELPRPLAASIDPSVATHLSPTCPSPRLSPGLHSSCGPRCCPTPRPPHPTNHHPHPDVRHTAPSLLAHPDIRWRHPRCSLSRILRTPAAVLVASLQDYRPCLRPSSHSGVFFSRFTKGTRECHPKFAT